MSKVVNNEIQANSLANNKIQAKTPEVGDIFYDEENDERLYIYKFLKDSNKEKYVRLIIKETYGLFIETFLLKDIKFESMKYLGKSKVKIEDLFKTENK